MGSLGGCRSGGVAGLSIEIDWAANPVAVAVGDLTCRFPNKADEVHVSDQRVYTVDDPSILQSGRHRVPQDGRYKYVGGASTLDSSMVYLFPCDAEHVLNGSICCMPLCVKAASKIVPVTSAVR